MEIWGIPIIFIIIYIVWRGIAVAKDQKESRKLEQMSPQ